MTTVPIQQRDRFCKQYKAARKRNCFRCGFILYVHTDTKPSEMRILQCFLLSWFVVSSFQNIRIVNVSEGDNALLPCTLNSGQKIDKFDWRKKYGVGNLEVFAYREGLYFGKDLDGQSKQFINRTIFFREELETGNASIIIKNTGLEDSGTYTCGLYERHRPVQITLNVDGALKIRNNTTGAARLPYVKTVQDEMTWRLLECKVKGVPAPKVEWRDSAGKILKKHDPDSQDVELQLVVDRSDNYTCVATQREISHQINNTLQVSIPEQSNALVVAIVIIGILLLVFGVIIGVLCVKMQYLRKNAYTRGESEPLGEIKSS